ncbi:serine O-acetyltransferase [Rhodococcus sp. NPDC003994]
MPENRAINMRNPVTVRLLFKLHKARRRTLFRALSVLMGVDLPFMDFGSTVLPHPVGVVIHGGVEFGERVTVYQNVTIASHPRENKAAIIEDDAVLCAGCVLVGPVRIGRGSIVGANAVVTSDVPPGVTVVGIPARVANSSRFMV